MAFTNFADSLSVLVWLDDLLDTRLSVMLNYDIKKTLSLIPTGYDLRTADAFIWEGLGITEDEWYSLYDLRDDDILLRSYRTGVVDFFRELLAEQLREPSGSPGRCPLSLTINTYPYYLTDDVKSAWRTVYKELIHPHLTVNFIRRHYGALSPAFVMQHYNFLLHYDWDKWAVEAGNSREKASMTSLTVVGPRIWKTAPDHEEQIKYAEPLEGMDVHMLAEMAVSLVFQLRLVPVDLWVAFKSNHSFSAEHRSSTSRDTDAGIPAVG